MASRLWLAALLALGPALSWAQQVKSVPVEPVGGVNVAVGSPGALPSAGSPSLSPSVSVSLGTPLSLPAAIVPRSFSGGAASRARPTAASELASSAGQTASPASRDVLAAERTALPAERVARMREIEGSLVRAAGEAASEEFGEETIAISRGSTARLTNDEDEPDYDLMVELPASWSAERAAKFFDGSDSDFYHRLQAAGARAAERLFPARAVVATVDFPRALIDPATHRISEGVLLFPLQIRDTATGTLLVDTDVSVTNKKEFANAYPQYFADQMERVRASGGPAAVERMLSDIRLAKKFFREAVGVYKAYKGGPGGVGVEQMVLNAGSFDKMVERLHEAAFDERGQPRSVRSARKAWNVPSP
ncbi:MAG: hypothetical protein HY925_09130, partial [Elusimicrobia bacterium]|nr:hypothetical protein [Elusimicrobiota bacterium]